MAAKTFIFCELKIGGRKVLDAAFVPPPQISTRSHDRQARQGRQGKARQGKASSGTGCPAHCATCRLRSNPRAESG